jgi:hypothetical protein
MIRTKRGTEQFEMAVISNADQWVPACSGYETPFRSRSGVRLLYCYNPRLHKHAYLNCDTDIILSDAEAQACLQMI